jgi:hypothetical protein
LEKIDELINRYNNENDKNIKNLISLSSSFSDKNTKQSETIDLGYFNIEYGLTIIYNTYLYMFKLVEICKDTPLIIDNINNLKNNLNDNTNFPENDLIYSNSATPKHKNIANLKNSKELEKSSNDKNKIIDNRNSKNDNNTKVYRVQCFNYVTPLVIIILSSLLITYIFILLYQSNMVSSSHKGFLILYYNYYQRDQLYALYSVSLSSYYHFTNITNLNDIMTENDYIDLIKRYSNEFQNSFHIFYDIYISNNIDDSSKIHFIFDENEVFQISNYYNQENIISDYIKKLNT